METLKAGPRDCAPVLVLRHKGIALAMKQSFWDRYGVAKENGVTHPITQHGMDRNPALLSSSRNEVPADFDEVALDRYVARGGIALACNLAFDDMIALVSEEGWDEWRCRAGDGARRSASRCDDATLRRVRRHPCAGRGLQIHPRELSRKNRYG